MQIILMGLIYNEANKISPLLPSTEPPTTIFYTNYDNITHKNEIIFDTMASLHVEAITTIF